MTWSWSSAFISISNQHDLLIEQLYPGSSPARHIQVQKWASETWGRRPAFREQVFSQRGEKNQLYKTIGDTFASCAGIWVVEAVGPGKDL